MHVKPLIFLYKKYFHCTSIKRSGNRKNAPKRSCLYICTFQDINKQTHFQWHLTSYHNYPFNLHPQVIVYVTYLKS